MKETNSTKKLNATSIIAIILCVIMLPILAVNVTLIAKGLLNSDAVPSVGGISPMIVLSDSMYPEIKTGDLIFVKTVEAGNIREGDTVAFFDPDSTESAVVTHRVVEIINDANGISFRTKGDANTSVDRTLVPAENIVGIWTGTALPKVGDVAMFMKSVPGLILCIGVPIILLVGFEMMRQRKYESKNEQKQAELLAELEELRALKAAQEKPAPVQHDSSPEATVGDE